MDILSKKKTTLTEKPVVGFKLEYTTVPKGEDQTVDVTQLCVDNRISLYHYHFAQPSPSPKFGAFINNDDYQFATVDSTTQERR